MRKRIVWVMFLISLVVFSGCQQKQEDLERMPGIDLPIQNMNTDLHLELLENANTFQMGDPIWLMLYNTADLPVVLNENYGITVFKLTDEKWEMTIDQTDKGLGNKWVLANGDELHLWESVVVDPAVFSSEQEKVRIVMVGNFVKDNGKISKEVGAYVDVTLHPK